MSWVFSIFVRALVLFAYLLLLASAVIACRKFLPEGRLKKLLLMDVQTRIW